MWLARRSKAITETVEQGEIAPLHVGERDMVGDSCTKHQERGVGAPSALPPGRPAGLPRSQMDQGGAVHEQEH